MDVDNYERVPSIPDETEWGAQDSVKYELKTVCQKNPKASSAETDSDVIYLNRKGMADGLWLNMCVFFCFVFLNVLVKFNDH